MGFTTKNFKTNNILKIVQGIQNPRIGLDKFLGFNLVDEKKSMIGEGVNPTIHWQNQWIFHINNIICLYKAINN